MKKIERSILIFPFYQGLVGDLLFYIAIDTLFLSAIKNLSDSQILSLTSISIFVCIAIQFPTLWLIRRLGNTNSVRVAGAFLVLSAVLITFSKSYYFILLGRVFHDLAVTLRSPSAVTVRNNLELIDRSNDYVKVRTSGNSVYAILTMLIAFVAPGMFNYNPYLPMYCCIGTCTLGFILSFFVKDYSDYNRIIPEKGEKADKKAKAKLNLSKLIMLAIIVYGIYYPIVNNGQTDGKLFIQQELLSSFDLKSTTNIIGIIVIVSRIVRVFSNIIFVKVYEKLQNRVVILLTSMLAGAIALMLFGSFIPVIMAKIIIMALGYMVILFIRDPFRIVLQDVIFDNTKKEHHQTLLTTLEFAVRIGTASLGMVGTLLLTKYTMASVMIVFLAVMLINTVLSVILYHMILKAKK